LSEIINNMRKSTGKILNKLREERGRSQIDVCQEIGKTPSWLSMLEAGKATTTLDVLTKLLDIYNCDLSHFFELVEEESRTIDNGLKPNVAITRLDEWQVFPLMDGITYLLSPFKLQGSKLDVTPVILKAKHRSGIIRHRGEEVLYVLSGEFILEFYEDPEGQKRIGDQYPLRQGDAVQFYTWIWHQGINNSDQNTNFLVVRCPKILQ